MDLVLWKSCSGALHRRKDARERAEMAAKREDRGIGNPTHTAYDMVGATQLEQLSVPFRGPGSSCAMCRLCRRGTVVAQQASGITVQRLHADPAQRLVFRGRVGDETVSMRCQRP
jgi:hypothetical protein